MSDPFGPTTIREWEHLPIGPGGVEAGAARRLQKLAERERQRLRAPQHVLALTARPSLQAGQVVGVLTVPGVTVEILPKMDGGDGRARKALVHMLAMAWGVPIADSEPALLGAQHENLLEVLVRLFADRLLVAARRGLPHRYRTMNDDLPALRGKLDVRRQIARDAVRADRLACIYDELSVDTPLNRVLKAAVQRLSSVTRSLANRRRLAELSARLEFVSESRNASRERVTLDRTNRAFHRLHALARLVLGDHWQDTTTGAQDGFALLFPMNQLFEEFVGRSMIGALAPQSVRLQDSRRHALVGDGDRYFALRPDIVVDGDTIVDTKWKALDAKARTLGVEQPDVYQMLAYGRAYSARRLVLVYPWHEALPPPGIIEQARWRVAGGSTPFEVATIDVGSPKTVRTIIREIIGDPTTTPARSSHRPRGQGEVLARAEVVQSTPK